MRPILAFAKRHTLFSTFVGPLVLTVGSAIVLYLLTRGTSGLEPILSASVAFVVYVAGALLIGMFLRNWKGPRSETSDYQSHLPSPRENPSSNNQVVDQEHERTRTGSSLREMLAAANAMDGSIARDEAFRIVAETALDQGDYETAIKAGDASPTSTGSSQTLRLVALSAAKAGQFGWSAKAAKKIPQSIVRDTTTVDILKVKRRQ